MKERLLDNWSISGNSLEDFYKEIKYLSSITNVNKVCAKNITLFSKNEFTASDPNFLKIFVLKPYEVWDVTKTMNVELKQGKMNRKTFEAAGAEELVKEFENSTKTLYQVDGKITFTSSNLPLTMGLRTGMKGEASAEPSLERDLLTVKRLESDDEISLIERNIGGVKKTFAALSGSYAYVPQSFLCDIIDRVAKSTKLGKINCHNWSINNQIAEIYLEFPERADEIATVYEMEDEIVPGLYLSKSDVGECSITVRSTWRINNSVIVQDEVKRKHTGKINVDDILDDIEKVVFSKYTVLPDALCALMSIDITDPSWSSTYSESKFMKMNEKAVSAAIKKVFDDIDLVGAICKKNEKAIYEQLCDEVDTMLEYTAYDIVMMVMQISSRVTGLAPVYKDALAKACGKAPYVNFAVKKTKVVLTA